MEEAGKLRGSAHPKTPVRRQLRRADAQAAGGMSAPRVSSEVAHSKTHLIWIEAINMPKLTEELTDMWVAWLCFLSNDMLKFSGEKSQDTRIRIEGCRGFCFALRVQQPVRGKPLKDMRQADEVALA